MCPTFYVPFAIFSHIYMTYNKLVKYESSISGVSLKALRYLGVGYGGMDILNKRCIRLPHQIQKKNIPKKVH